MVASQQDFFLYMTGLPKSHIRFDENLPVSSLGHHIIVVQGCGIGCDAGLHSLTEVREVEPRCGRERQFRLSAGDESGRCGVAEVCGAWMEPEPSFAVSQGIFAVVRIAQTHPSHGQA